MSGAVESPPVPLAPLIEVRGLSVALLDPATGDHREVLGGVDLSLESGRALGLTGISGGGKSTLIRALAGRLPESSRIVADAWRCFDRDLLQTRNRSPIDGRTLNAAVRTAARGRMFLIAQDARLALVPYRTVAWHLKAAARRSPTTGGPGRGHDKAGLLRSLEEIGFHHPERILDSYPAELSGGECQRIQLAIARRLSVRLLLADEPFSFVDPACAEMLTALLRTDLESGSGLAFVSHQLKLLSSLTDRTAIVCNGRIAEQGPTANVLSLPSAAHPHTRLLLRLADPAGRVVPHVQEDRFGDAACVFRSACDRSDESCREAIPTLRQVDGGHGSRCVKSGMLEEEHAAPEGAMPAVSSARGWNRVEVVIAAENLLGSHVHARWFRRPPPGRLLPRSLRLRAGEIVGLGGKSGCGKTTFARMLMGLHPADQGRLERFEDPALSGNPSGESERQLWKRIQWVSQDSDVAFDPLSTVRAALIQSYHEFGSGQSAAERESILVRLLSKVRLEPGTLDSLTGNLSGGERRRVALVRALATFGYLVLAAPPQSPRVLILDEPTVGIDLFLQAFLIDLLLDAAQTLNLTMLLISHDERFLGRICDRVLHWRESEVILTEPKPVITGDGR